MYELAITQGDKCYLLKTKTNNENLIKSLKLFYYKDPTGNFGDDLNPYIWYNLAPDIFNANDSHVFIGIGTLINSRAPEAPIKHVFGSGVGYHQFPKIDSKWNFYCVRGPLSAQRLGIDKSLAITDPAVLVTQVLPDYEVQRTGKVCFMPHHASAQFADWKHLCQQAGIDYIDPANDIHDTILQMRQSRLVLAEAMHAAIVADALRVPWIPIVCYDHILDFKWDDWCQSLNMNYLPQRIISIWDMEREFSITQKVKTNIKRGIIKAGMWSDIWTPPVQVTNKHEVEDLVVSSLIDLANSGTACLSDDRAHHESISRLMDKLQLVRRDFAPR